MLRGRRDARGLEARRRTRPRARATSAGSPENAREAMNAPGTVGTSRTGARSTSMPSPRQRPAGRRDPAATAASPPAAADLGRRAVGREAREALHLAALLIDRHQRRRRAAGRRPPRRSASISLAERARVGAVGREQDHAAELAVARPPAQAVGRRRLHPDHQHLPGEPARAGGDLLRTRGRVGRAGAAVSDRRRRRERRRSPPPRCRRRPADASASPPANAATRDDRQRRPGADASPPRRWRRARSAGDGPAAEVADDQSDEGDQVDLAEKRLGDRQRPAEVLGGGQVAETGGGQRAEAEVEEVGLSRRRRSGRRSCRPRARR